MVIAAVDEHVPEFPVSWDDPDDAAISWTPDAIHFAQPLSPLFRTLWGPAFEAGITQAGREVIHPGFTYRVRFVNGFYFQSLAFRDAPADELRATEAAMAQAADGLMDRWEHEWLPRLRATNAWLAETDPAGTSPAELLRLLDRLDEVVREQWLIHFRIVWPVMQAMQRFDDLTADLFGAGSEADGHALLIGLPAANVLAGIALSDLAGHARALGLDGLVRAADPAELLPALAQSEEGRALADDIGAYLEEHGLQQDGLDYLAPTWRERPEIVAGQLQTTLRSGHDARAEHAAAVARAGAATDAARQQIAAFPAPVRAEFDSALAAARAAYFLHCEHNAWIDQRGIALQRLFLLKVGAWLAAAGVIATPDDVLMLTHDELRRAIAEPADLRAHVAARWAELERQRALTPPPWLGAPPEEAPPPGSAIERAFARYDGAPPPAGELLPSQIAGTPGSRGVVSGRARVARTLEEAWALQPGEILVTTTTLPTWSSLFAVAAAIVTETGGPLSHSAIVAREYEIPAVVGAAGATAVITTGDQITVDGSRGIVTREES